LPASSFALSENKSQRLGWLDCIVRKIFMNEKDEVKKKNNAKLALIIAVIPVLLFIASFFIQLG